MKKNIPLILFLLLLTQITYSQIGGTWTQKADISTSNRESGVGFSANTKSYVGLGNVGGSPNGTLWEFDHANNTWTQKANMTGGGRVSAVAFAIGSNAYVGTGEDLTFTKDKKFYQFNTLANTWTAKLDFGGTARTEAVGFAIGSKGYLGTGNDGVKKKDFWEYDPTGNTWTQKADFGGTARQGAVGFSVGTKGYIGTGNDGALKKDFWEYDPTLNTWIQKADFGGAAREGAVGFGLSNGRGYIATGDSGTGKNDIWEYNPESNEWLQRANFTGQRRYVAVGFSSSYTGKGYIGTGFTDQPSTGVSTKDFFEFSPPVPPAKPLNAMVTFFSENSIRLNWLDVSNDETGFIIERSTDGTIFTTLITTVANAVSYTDNGLTNGQKYYYRVRSTKADGPSGPTNVASQTTGKNDLGVWVTLDKKTSNPKFDIKLGKFVINDILYLTHVGSGSNVMWSYDPAKNTFTQKADFAGTARVNAASFALNGKGYTGTGVVSGTSQYLNDFWEYDPAANQWVQKANVGTLGRNNSLAFALGNKGYLGSGYTSALTDSKDFYEFDPLANTWTAKADLPATAPSGVSVGYNGKGYALLANYTTNAPFLFFEYDPITNSWVSKASFPIKNYGFKEAMVSQNKFFLTAYTVNENPGRSALWEYELANDRWTEKAAHSTENSYSWATSAVIAGQIFQFYDQSVFIYDPLNGLKPPTLTSAIAIDPIKVKLTWSINDPAATKTIIYRSIAETGPFDQVAELTSDKTTYTDTFQGPADNAFYKIRSVNAVTQSNSTVPIQASKQGAWKELKKITPTTDFNFELGPLSIAANSKGYVGLGSNKTLWEYNPSTDSWSQKASFPGEARYDFSSFAIDNKIYVGLGFKNTADMLKDFWMFDPAANVWVQKKDFAGTARRYARATAYNGVGYLVGGEDDAASTSFLKESWAYDPVNDSWSTLPNAPIASRPSSLYVYNNKLWLVNGYIKTNATSSQTQVFQYSFDLTSKTWSQGNNPGYQTAGTVNVINDIAYFFYLSSAQYLITYNHKTDKWAYQTGYPGSSYSTTGFAIGNKIYAIGSNYDVWVFNADALVAAPENLSSQFFGNRIALSWENMASVPVKTKIQLVTTNSSGNSQIYTDLGVVENGVSQFLIDKLESDKNYKFRAIAFNSTGEQSGSSNYAFENSGPYWTKIGEGPTSTYRYAASTIVLNSKVYYGMGTGSNSNSDYTKDFWQYDPANGTWTQKSDFGGGPRSSAAIFNIGSDIYAGFGRNSSFALVKDLWKYNSSTNVWTPSVDYPKGTGLEGAGIFYNGNDVYFFGGLNSEGNSSNELWKFDGNAWSQLTSLPGDPRRNPIAFAINGKAYIGTGQKVVGGSYYSGGKDFWEYNIASDSWKQLKDVPNELITSDRTFSIISSTSAAVINPSNSSGVITKTYDPVLDKWGGLANPFHEPYLSNNFNFAQDKVSGFGYAIVNSTTYGNKLWRFNYILGGPNLVTASFAAPNAVTLKWRKIIPQPDSVVIYRSEVVSELGSRIGSVKTNDTTAINNNVALGKTYYYRIRSYSSAGQFKTSSEKMLYIENLPAAPINLVGEFVGNEIKLSWEIPAGPIPTSYTIERAVNSETLFEKLSTATTKSYTTSDFPGQRLLYRVKASNTSGDSPYSNSVLMLVTGLEESKFPVQVYPNPTHDYITIQLENSKMIVPVELLNSEGKTLYSGNLDSNTSLDLTTYPAGIYFLTFVNKVSHKKEQIKIVKQ